MTELSLSLTRVVDAPVEKVFNAWLSPESLRRFMAPGDMHVKKAETDARVGGRFLIVMGKEEREIPHAGTYLTIDPHSKIVFTWESPFSIDGSTVTLDFKPSGGGATEVTLTQVKFSSEGSRDGHKEGWTGILDRLVAFSF